MRIVTGCEVNNGGRQLHGGCNDTDMVGIGRPLLSINGAFRPQRLSGQQRYATEISAELLRRPEVDEIGVPPRFASRRAATWAWVEAGLPLHARGHTLLSLTSRAPALARRHVVTVHDLFPLSHPEWYSRRYVALHAPLLRHHLAHAEALIAVSDPVAEQLRARAGRAVDVVVAPNAPSAVFGSATDPSLVRAVLARVGRADLSSRAGYLLSVGSADPRKNLARLVDAHRTLSVDLRRSFPLIVAGGESDVFRGGGIAGSDDVIRAGYVTDAELAALYAGAAAVALPSLDEGFGLPAVEAVVSGARLALSDIAVFRWICGDDAEYFTPTSVESIRAALDNVLTTPPDPGRTHRLVTSVRARFSWPGSAEQIFDSVSARHGNR